MRITISGKNIDVTQGLKDAVYEKLGKLEKYFTPETEAISYLYYSVRAGLIYFFFLTFSQFCP